MAETEETIILRTEVQGMETAVKNMDSLIGSLTRVVKIGDKVYSMTGKIAGTGKGGWGQAQVKVKALDNALPKFKMHLLSLMFAGQLLSRTFGRMRDAIWDVFGVSEYLGAAMEVIATSTGGQVVADLGYSLGDAAINADDTTQSLIALGMPVIEISGSLLSLTAQLGLTIFALSTVAEGGGILGVVLGVLGAAVLPLTLIIGFLALCWITNWGKIHEMASYVIEGLMSVLGGLWDMIQGIINLDFNKFMYGLFSILDGLGEIAFGIIGFFANLIAGMFDWGVKLAKGILDGIGSVLSGIGTFLWNLIPEPFKSILQAGANVVGGVIGDIGNIFGNLFHFAEGGVVTSPTLAMVGESGPEAIIPLNKAGGMTGNITNNIVVNANVASSVDIRNMARELSEYMIDEYRRQTVI